jgi:hypothetical protein
VAEHAGMLASRPPARPAGAADIVVELLESPAGSDQDEEIRDHDPEPVEEA